MPPGCGWGPPARRRSVGLRWDHEPVPNDSQGVRVQAMNSAIAVYWHAAAAQTYT